MIITRIIASPRRDLGPRTFPPAVWGMAMLVVTESMIFAALLSAYFFTRAGSPAWPQGGIAPPELVKTSIFTVVLLSSSVPVWWAERGIKAGDVRQLRVGLAIGFVQGAAFLTYTGFDLATGGFGIRDNAYASLFHVIIGLHAIHVAIGLAMNAGVQAKARAGRIDAHRHVTVQISSIYWHFVDVVWVFVFSSLYLSVAR